MSTDITQSTTVASIYQAGEGLVRLFDKILLIYDGKQVYFGPMDKAYDYFYEMGYQPFLRQTTADFLVSVTDPHGRAVREGYENRVPRTADEMVAYWRSSELGKANSRQVEEVHAEMKETKGSDDWAHRYKSDARTEQARHVRKGSRFILSWPMQTRLCIKRRAQIVVGACLFHYLGGFYPWTG